MRRHPFPLYPPARKQRSQAKMLEGKAVFSESISELVLIVEHVRGEGVEVHGPVRLDWMGADSYYVYDPNSNLLEWWARDER